MCFDFSAHHLDADIAAAYQRLMPHHGAETIPRRLAWRFERHPSQRGGFGVARRDGAIVGITAFMPARLKVGKRILPGLQAIDTIVDPIARGKGVFVETAKAAYAFAEREGIAAVFGFPNAAAAPGWFRHLGWTELGQAPFLIKPLRTGYFLKKIIGDAVPIDLPISFVKTTSRTTVAIDYFDKAVDRIWHAFAESIGVAVDRAHDYLNWRLFKHPTAKYEARAVFDGCTMRAVVVINLADKHGGRIGYIMEALCLPSAHQELVDLLRISICRMQEERVDAALAWCLPHSPNFPDYRRLGFLSMPNWLRPVKMSIGAKAFSEETSVVLNPKAWYLSYLDSDTV